MYRVEFLRPSPALSVEVCRTEHSGPLPPGWLAPGFVANLVVDGQASLRARGASHHVGPGDVVLANAGEFRRVDRRLTAVAVTRSFTIDARSLERARAERSGGTRPLHFRGNTTTHPGLRTALMELYRSIDGDALRLAVDSRIERVVDEVLALAGAEVHERWRAHPAIDRARDLIESQAEENVSLSDLVGVTGLSRAHVIKAFTREFGISPHRYQVHCRVLRARELLARGRTPADAASAVGFYDQSHLTRHFRRIVGIGPGEYARLAAGTRRRD